MNDVRSAYYYNDTELVQIWYWFVNMRLGDGARLSARKHKGNMEQKKRLVSLTV